MKRLLAYTYGLVSYAAFIGSILYLMGFLAGFAVPRSVDSGPGGSGLAAIGLDILLVALFGLQHSIMARPGFKRWLTRRVPAPVERSTFVLASSLVLFLLFWQWRPLPGALWEVGGRAGAALTVLYWAGWALAFGSTFVFSHTELFGLRQVHAHLRDRATPPIGFRTPLLYRIVRHPMHAGMLLALWAAPRMSGGHLLFSVAMTAYLLIGIHFEERELVRAFGERYERYRRAVPGLIPAVARGRVLGVVAGSALLAGLLVSATRSAIEAADVDGAPADSTTVLHGSLRRGGLRRTFDYYVPPGLPNGAPLVVVLHGSGGTGSRVRGFLGGELERLATRRRFAIAYPDGFEGHWNDCRARAPFAANRRSIDDVAYVRELVRWLVRRHGVDPKRTRVIGFSNGGHMAYRLAIEAPEAVQAVVAIGANLPVPDELDCMPGRRPVPLMVVNGTADPINPFEGGEVIAPGGVSLGRVRSARATALWFASRVDRAGELQRLEVVAPGDGSKTWVERLAWGRPDAPDVLLYTVHGGGHTIPGPKTSVPVRVGPTYLGATERRFDAIAEAVAFFEEAAALPRSGAAASPAVRPRSRGIR